ncbi:MAG: glycoside hydrolase family 2 protein [Victivallales bacterium]
MTQVIRTEWEFRAVNPPQDKGKLSEFRPASVPGTVQIDLIKSGDIPEPFIRDNLKELGWFYGVSWEYRTRLSQVPADKKCRMVFEGIDTISTVELNGEIIARTGNMHICHEFDLTGKLVNPQNTLTVQIECPRKHADEKSLVAEFKVSEYHCQGNPKFLHPHIRKSAYSAGWDWLGNVPPSSGIWKPAYLCIDDTSAVIRNTNYLVELSKDLGMAEITAEIEILAHESTLLIASLEVDGLELLPSHRIRLEKGLNRTSLRPVKIFNPTLWWPNGHGSHSLYRMTLKLYHAASGETITDEKHIGIRKVRLLQPKDKEGRKFVIEINGRKIFTKGGNWIPNDAYLPRVKAEKVERLVSDAEESNYNMLRIWGGGFYEDNHFFELCDRAGIMVLMDFPFACNLYPEDDGMVSSIRTEVEQNIRRIRHHPSLVLLSGNNECYPCHFAWLKLTKEVRFFGRKIYEEVLPEICRKLIPDIPYVPGSPYSPDKPEDPDAPECGDRHAWWLGFGISKEKNYLHMNQEKGRFISEFGYLGMPPYSTVKQFLQGRDISRIDSDVLASHENVIVTMKMLKEYAEFMFPLPDNLKNYCYLSMIAQAEMLRYAVEHFRRRKFDCGGSVIWQYNDCWPAPSWSAVDYYLRRKAHYYYIKRAYAPIIASFNRNEDGLVEAWAVNDKMAGGHCELRMYRCDCVDRKEILSKKFEMPANKSIKLAKISPDKFDPKKEFLVAEIIKEGKMLARNTYFGVVPKEFNWPARKDFSVAHEKVSGTVFKVTLSPDCLLKDLYMNIDFADPDAVFSDNFIDVLPEDRVEIKVKTSRQLSLEEFINAFSMTHLSRNFAVK